MKQLVLSILAFPVFAFSQSDCNTAVTIQGNNTYNITAFSGTSTTPCFGLLTESGEALQTHWYKYTATQSGLVSISSNLPANESPNSENTRLSILTGNCDALTCYDSADDVDAAAQNFLTNLTFPVQAGNTYFIVWDSFYENNPFEFEFTFTPQSCTRVYYIDETSNNSNTEITLNWEPSVNQPPSYTVQYGLQGFTLGTGTSISTNEAQITLASLQAGATFDYYIRANCSGNQDSEWSGPHRFTLTKTVPYNSGFDSTQELGGWTRVNGSPNFNLVTNAANALSAPSYFLMNALVGQTNNYWLISPEISLENSADYIITFNFRTSSASANRTLTLTLGTSEDPSTHTQIIAAEPALNSNPGYSAFTYSFTVPTTGQYYIGLHDTSFGVINSSLRIDNFLISSNLNIDSLKSDDISIYPNPANETLYIKNAGRSKIDQLELLDFEGRLIRSLSGDFDNQRGHSISDLSTGVYLVKISSGNMKLIKKLIKR
ncbi:T9SS type A sorting domain-containing protein [Flavobacterium sp.]|uniref:T9SS-dependent choice-of-anchor J family protein n=1 Tax=Flavobacterium sp. TaxID=239 RepID=UPI00261150BB|nr:T9SS type A sorting domain-containing protein [Flavobacterium sp.]